MNTQLIITLAVLVFMAVSFMVRKISFGLTGMICMLALAVTGVIDLNTAFSGFSNKTTILVDAGSWLYRKDKSGKRNPQADVFHSGEKRNFPAFGDSWFHHFIDPADRYDCPDVCHADVSRYTG